MAEQIVQLLLGEPNRSLSTKHQLRWGRKGSFALNVAGDGQGLWFDHENEIGGDIIDFVKQQRGCSISLSRRRTISGSRPSNQTGNRV
jgi:putative DNA primase/helicase